MNATVTIGDLVDKRKVFDKVEIAPPRLELGDHILIKDFMSRGRNLGDVEMRVVMHTCNRVQLENPRLGFRGWFPIDSNRMIAIENQE